MADQKISELTAITGANTADDDLLVIVDTSTGETKKITLAELEAGIARGDMTFGDNDKAIFGAGSDLQIYHSGTNSVISDQGTGDLVILGDQVVIKSASGSSTKAAFNSGGATELYHASSALKLATTSTGIDVTGTATMDGLTVDGSLTDFLVGKQSFEANHFIANNFNTATSTVGNAGYYTQSIEFFGSNGNGVSVKTSPSIGTTPVERMRVDYLGDISFYEDTGTTAKFFWDASAESLGIGTTTPSAKLHLFNSTGSSAAYLQNGLGNTWKIDSFSDGKLFFGIPAVVDVMTMTSAGNVGIGTTSPSNPLQVQGNIGLNNSSGTQVALIAPSLGGSFRLQGQTTEPMTFWTNNTERARLDSSGNLLVGKTAIDTATVGVEARPIGYLTTTRDGGAALVVTRKTSDGDLAVFLKDGTTVGSIGVGNSNDLYIGSADTGVMFKDNDIVDPWNPSTNTQRDNAIDLGSSLGRFKDLYLSGGVYVGGTGAANYLDDYEEGTWTPTVAGLTLTVSQGSYTKIGRQVVANYKITSDSATSSDIFNLGGLPFSPTDNGVNGAGRSAGYITYNGTGTDATQLFGSGSGNVQFRSVASGTIQTITSFSGATLWGTVIFYVA